MMSFFGMIEGVAMNKSKIIIKFILLPLIFCAVIVIALNIHMVRYMEEYYSINYLKNNFTEDEIKILKDVFEIPQDCNYRIEYGVLTLDSLTLEFECTGTLEEIWSKMFHLQNLPDRELHFNGLHEWESPIGDVRQVMYFVPYQYNNDIDSNMDVIVWQQDEKYRVVLCIWNKHQSDQIWEMFKE